MQIDIKKSLNFIKISEYNFYENVPLGCTQERSYFDHRDRIIKNQKGIKFTYNTEPYDSTNYNFFKEKLFKSKMKKLLKLIKFYFVNISDLPENLSRLLLLDEKEIKKELQKFIKEEKISTDANLVSVLIYLNYKWFNKLEISYYIRKSLDLINHKLSFLAIAYSDLNSTKYCNNWESFSELNNYTFIEKYKGIINLNKFIKSKPMDVKKYLLSFSRVSKLRYLDNLRKKNKNIKPGDFLYKEPEQPKIRLNNEAYNSKTWSKWEADEKKQRKERWDNYVKQKSLISEIKCGIKQEFGLYTFSNKWKSQNKLYENCKSLLKEKEIKVFREFPHSGLKNQNLDVYFNINGQEFGIEYQGEQHYKPINFFGGEKSFKYRKRLDSLKRRRCKKAGVNLIEFKYNEAINKPAIINKFKQNGIKVKGGEHVQNI